MHDPHDPHCPGCRGDTSLKGIDPLGIMARRKWRELIAEEIIRRVDTVTLLKVEEVQDIRQRALDGEYDGISFLTDPEPDQK